MLIFSEDFEAIPLYLVSFFDIEKFALSTTVLSL